MTSTEQCIDEQRTNSTIRSSVSWPSVLSCVNIYEIKTQQDATAQLEALQGDRGSALWAVSTETGEEFTECALPSVPIYDGMAAAYGKLYVALADGNVVCLGPN